MNVSQIARMAGRMVMRRLIGKGINAGIDAAWGAGKAKKDMTPEERARHDRARSNAKRSKQAMKILRRSKRF